MSRMRRLAVMQALALGLAACASTLDGSEVLIPGAGSTYEVSVRSMADIRFQHVVRQRYDFSCGSAAVATLLTYHYGRPTSEDDAFRAMWDAGDQATIERVGFSLLDIKRYLATQGLRADGFRVSLPDVARAHVAGITLINTQGYQHFVVLTGTALDEIENTDDGSHRPVRESVLVADPALGLRTIPRDEFEQSWNGVFFIVRDEPELARAGFDREEDWEVQASSPFRHALGPAGLAMFTMMMPTLRSF
jgi:predicted double-glycine peptidase